MISVIGDHAALSGPIRNTQYDITSTGTNTILPQVTVIPVGGAYTEKKNTIASHPPELRLSFERAQAKRAHLKVALLAERHARGPDGQHMRSPQLARCSRDQIRLRMAALARG